MGLELSGRRAIFQAGQRITGNVHAVKLDKISAVDFLASASSNPRTPLFVFSMSLCGAKCKVFYTGDSQSVYTGLLYRRFSVHVYRTAIQEVVSPNKNGEPACHNYSELCSSYNRGPSFGWLIQLYLTQRPQ